MAAAALQSVSGLFLSIYPCTGMQRIFFWVEKILVTTSWFLLVPCSEMMMDL